MAEKTSVKQGKVQRLVRWPRGKYNGRKVVGIKLLFRINVLCWQWRIRPKEGLFCIGPFIWNYEPNYHYLK